MLFFCYKEARRPIMWILSSLLFSSPLFYPMTNPSPKSLLQLKRQKIHHPHAAEHHPDTPESHRHQHQSLLPGLSDHVAHLCLSRVPLSTLFSVCHTWRRLIYSPSFTPFLNIYALLIRPHEPNSVHFAAYDPISAAWRQLPPPPQLRLLLRHPSYISRRLPLQSVAVSDALVLVSGTDDRFMPALTSPLVFSPSSGTWAWGPHMSVPRRWCAVGGLGGAVYVASGIGSHYSTEVARSVERWNIGIWLQSEEARTAAPGGPWDNGESEEFIDTADDYNTDQDQIAKTNKNPRWSSPRTQNGPQISGRRWEKMGNLRDGKFSRDAIDAVGWRGKLCMVNVEGNAAKDGTIYDAAKDTWTDMPDGMLMGWRGPATVTEEDTLYVVDESKGILKKYDQHKDAWSEVAEHKRLRGARQVAARGGKVCVLGSDGCGITVVDTAGGGGKVWDVDVPDGLQIMGIHILPRMNHCLEL